MPLALPDQPRRFYRDNPLRLVVCQMRFPVMHGFDEPGSLARFQEVLRDRYPRSAPAEQQLGGAGLATTPGSQPGRYWRFDGVEDGWSVAVARDFVSLETTRYTRFEEFRERFAQVLAAATALGVTIRDRLGLRYVDEITHPNADRPADWRGLINERLLGMVGGEELGDDVLQAIQEIRLRQPDGLLTIRHGYLGAEATTRGAFYLLDTDYFQQQSTPLAPEGVLAQLDVYHRTLHNIFETAITEPLRDHLGVVEQANA
jgi:uncharacterized protein (TIGR04255 family)